MRQYQGTINYTAIYITQDSDNIMCDVCSMTEAASNQAPKNSNVDEMGTGKPEQDEHNILFNKKRIYDCDWL